MTDTMLSRRRRTPGSSSLPGAAAALRAPEQDRGRWTLRRVLALGLMLLVPLTLIFAFAPSAQADEDEDVSSYSFYNMSSNIAGYFSNGIGPEGELNEDLWGSVMSSPGSAGSMLAYVDGEKTSFGGWLFSSFSASSSSMDYKALQSMDEDGNVSDSHMRGMLDYAQFGATVNGLGLDSTTTELSLGFGNMVGGGVMLTLYFLSYIIDALFYVVITALTWLNPFKLFYLGVEAISPTFANGMVGGEVPDNSGPLMGLAEWIGGWYEVLNSIAWTVMVPLFIGILLMSLFMFKNMNKGGAIKKLLIRIVFIGVGLPLLGSMYTGTLNSMGDASASPGVKSSELVLRTYVDFESWAMNSRMHIPEGATIEWQAGTSSPSGDSVKNVRDSALAINRTANSSFSGVGGTDITEGGAWVDLNESTGPLGGLSDLLDSVAFNGVVDMLNRHMDGATLTPSSWESGVHSELSDRMTGDEATKTQVNQWFVLFNDSSKLGDGGHEVDGADLASVVPNNPVINTSGGLQGAAGNPNTTTVKTFTSGEAVNNCFARVSTDSGAPLNCTLSPLAMYNYLNTNFGAESMTMYSSENANSGATREVHASVNLVGTGVMSLLYWLNTAVLLGAFITIGFGYALSMFIASIRRSIQTMTAIPFATLGAIAGIAKVIVYSFALIIEVLLTIFIYKFVQEFLISLPQIIETPFAALMNSGAGDGVESGLGLIAILSPTAVTLTTTVVSILAVILFTIMAMRLRKSIIKAIEEATTKIVEKFMDTSVGAPSGGGGMAPALAGGMAAGAGAAAANRMMSGGSKGSGPRTSAGGVGGGGPEGLSTGSGDGPGGADSNVSGEIGSDGTLELEGGDGPGELGPGGAGSDGGDGPDGGPGDSGMGMSGTDGADGTGAGTEAGGGVADEIAEGRRVEAQGLSGDPSKEDAAGTTGAASQGQDGQGMDSADGPSAGLASGADAQADGEQGADRQLQVGDGDGMDAAAGSMQESQEGYEAADKQKLAAGTEGAQAVGHGAMAVGRGVAGDGAGAAESGGKALEHGGQAAAAGERSKQAEADAGRSSLDKPDNTHAKRAQTAEGVSAAGGAVANTAGKASSTGGAGSAAKSGGTEAAKSGAKNAKTGSSSAKSVKGGTGSGGTGSPSKPAAGGGKPPAGGKPAAGSGGGSKTPPKPPAGGNGGGQRRTNGGGNTSGTRRTSGGTGSPGNRQSPPRKPANPPKPPQGGKTQAPPKSPPPPKPPQGGKTPPPPKPGRTTPPPPKPNRPAPTTRRNASNRTGNTSAARDGVRKAADRQRDARKKRTQRNRKRK